LRRRARRAGRGRPAMEEFPKLERLELRDFTAFESLDLDFSPGVNVFIGENATGKTHILKVLYACLAGPYEQKRWSDKLTGVFMPLEGRVGRLVHRRRGRSGASARVVRGGESLRLAFSCRATTTVKLNGRTRWSAGLHEAVFVPVKELLANAPGFASLYRGRLIEFDETHVDLIDRAYRPPLRGRPEGQRAEVLRELQDHLEGRIVIENERFFVRGKRGTIEFSLVSEGQRKLALIWLLVQSGVLAAGSTLFWDEPEANLNPTAVIPVAGVLLRLQRAGVQVFVATHSLVLAAALDALRGPDDALRYHGLTRGETITCQSVDHYREIEPNLIEDAHVRLLEMEVAKLRSEAV
jgi:hypothetical protein